MIQTKPVNPSDSHSPSAQMGWCCLLSQGLLEGSGAVKALKDLRKLVHSAGRWKRLAVGGEVEKETPAGGRSQAWVAETSLRVMLLLGKRQVM